LTLVPASMGMWDPKTRMFKAHVETFWESWDEGKDDYVSNLFDLPTSPIGSKHGVNVVNIAFALPNVTSDYQCDRDPGCITEGYRGNSTYLHYAVDKIHASGGFVKLAIGGETYGNPGSGLKLSDVRSFCYRISNVVKKYNLDGVDLTQVQDCGLQSDCGLVEIQQSIISNLRSNLPDAILSYTFPGNPTSLLHKPVLEESYPYLDYIVGFRGSSYLMEQIQSLGIPPNKIVWGINNVHQCGLGGVLEAANFVRTGGYGGVLTWSINSDTDHRGSSGPGECTEFQTGHPDGTYVNMISYLLNQ